MMKPCPKKPLILVATLFILSSSSARGTITPSTPLADNETLVSSDGRFALGFFTPPNSYNRYIGLWYNLISDHTIQWVANRKNPLVYSPGVLSGARDGRFTISNLTLFVVWSTDTTKGLTNPMAQLLDSGNLVVKQLGDASENYLWQGFNFLTHTFLPGMRMGVDFSINRTLSAWKGNNDPSPGCQDKGVKALPGCQDKRVKANVEDEFAQVFSTPLISSLWTLPRQQDIATSAGKYLITCQLIDSLSSDMLTVITDNSIHK